MEGKLSKIAILAPFAAGIGRKPGRIARIRDDLTPALAEFGRECVLEVPRFLLAEGRIAVPLPLPGELTLAAWIAQEPGLRRQEAAQVVEGQGPLSKQPTTSSPLDALLDMVALPAAPPADTAAGAAPETAILTHILAHPDYQSRAAAWQGLGWLLALAQDSIDWLLVDVDPAACPDELAGIEEVLLTEEPELLIVDLPLTNTPRDQETLAVLARMGDRLLAPVLAWLDSPFWGLDHWQGFDRLAYLPTHLDRPQYGKWRALGKRQEARLLCATTGRFALAAEQLPGPDRISEQIPSVWLAPVWALAAFIVHQQQESGFPYPLAPPMVPLSGSAPLRLEVPFSDDRCQQLLSCHISPLTGSRQDRCLSFPGLVLADGTSLETQLCFRSLLSWLLGHPQSNCTATDLRADLLAHWRQAGIRPPLEIDFSMEEGELVVRLRPLPARSSGDAEITLRIPWDAPANPGTHTGA